MNIKNIVVVILILLSSLGVYRWRNRANNDITQLSNKVCIQEGKFVMFHWSASEAEVVRALNRWQHLKRIQMR